MREKEYLQCLHFGVLVQGKLGEHMHHIACCANEFFFHRRQLGEKNNVCWPERLIEFQYGGAIVFLANQSLLSQILVTDFVLILQMVYQIKLYQ